MVPDRSGVTHGFFGAGAWDGAAAAQVIRKYFASASFTSSTDHHSGTRGAAGPPAAQQLLFAASQEPSSTPPRLGTREERSSLTTLLEARPASASDPRGRQDSGRSAASPWRLAHTAARSLGLRHRYPVNSVPRAVQRSARSGRPNLRSTWPARAPATRSCTSAAWHLPLTLPSAVLRAKSSGLRRTSAPICINHHGEWNIPGRRFLEEPLCDVPPIAQRFLVQGIQHMAHEHDDLEGRSRQSDQQAPVVSGQNHQRDFTTAQFLTNPQLDVPSTRDATSMCC